MTQRPKLMRVAAAGMLSAAAIVSAPAIAGAGTPGVQPAHAVPVPYCEVLPMILIYPPPPTTVLCHTPWGDFTFMLPPGSPWG
ncbi:hypothetical protein [Hoyosella altamirensis]|uniref:Secreted protein n=1 Tax=Hoyosella altamirensis TaxID=616997 RepID=A0A839RKE6_9ACTN|nr:hypothetical protein [Hoyosella altamirensis]MBB3036779.1 hypothetical protein [Hoyosella altamirensis]